MNINRFLDALMILFAAQIVRTYLASFRKKDTHHKLGYYTAWILYFLLQYLIITSTLQIDSPLLLILNILLITLILFFSGSDMKAALFHATILTASWMAVEAITHGILLAAGTDGEYFFTTGNLISKIAMYIIIQAYRRVQDQNHGISLPLRHWIELVLVPISSMCIIYTTRLLIIHKWTNGLFALISILMILVNYVIFDVYEKIGSQALMEKQNHAYEQEIGLCMRQAEEREAAYRQTRILRHDIKDRLVSLGALLEAGHVQKAKREISQMLEENSLNRHGIAETGNLALDALVNYKYDTIVSKGIQMNCLLDVPAQLFIEGTDLCVILGNLLDNALEATEKIPIEEKPWITLSIKLTKEVLLICTENPYAGEVKTDGHGKLFSSKKGEHGIGLISIEKTASKYGGEVTTSHEKGIFRISVILCQKKILHGDS